MSYQDVVDCYSCNKPWDVTDLNVGDEFTCTNCGAECAVPRMVTRISSRKRNYTERTAFSDIDLKPIEYMARGSAALATFGLSEVMYRLLK